MLAIGFLNALLLPGLALAAAPIVIHLLSRRRFRRIEWGALRFLLEAEKENRRRVRFEQWLLVALRVLAMALLALVLARPFVQPGALAALLGGEGRRLRVVVIDDSASMSAVHDRQRGFARSIDAAGRLVDWLRREAPGDLVAVYLTSRPEEPLRAPEPLSESFASALQDELRRLQPVHARADAQRTLAALRDDLAASGASAMVYLFSDFQRSDWLAGGAAGAFAPLLELGDAAPRVMLIGLGEALRANLAVVEAVPERQHAIAGVPALVQVRVANHARTARADVQIRAEVDGAALPPVAVEPIEAGQERVATLEVTFAEPGPRVLTIGVDAGDGFPLDDVRRLVVPVRESLDVLVVNGQPSADPQLDEVFLLRNALTPPGPFASGVRLEVIDAGELEAAALPSFDVVLLCNPPPPTQSAAAALLRFARAGGGVAVFLGSESAVDADGLNRALFADGQGLLPLAIAGVRGGGADVPPVALVAADAHPVTAMLAAGVGAGEPVRFRSFVRMEDPPASADTSAVQTLARFSDEQRSPAILERSIGRGRAMIFAFSTDMEWHNWPQSPDGSYVVTLQELVQYLARPAADPFAFVAGEPLQVVISAEQHEPTALLRSPRADETAMPLRPRDATVGVGEDVVLVGSPVLRTGIFQVELSRVGGLVEQRPLAVNPDARESDLAIAGRGELSAALQWIPHEFAEASESFLAGAESTRREFWRTLLLLLILVLMAEQALAWWFGTARGATRVAGAASVTRGRMATWVGLRSRTVGTRH